MRRMDWVAVTVLLLFAAGLRIIGISYGQLNPDYFPSTAPLHMLHEQVPIQPDEYFSVAVPMDMALRKNLNPRFFNQYLRHLRRVKAYFSCTNSTDLCDFVKNVLC